MREKGDLVMLDVNLAELGELLSTIRRTKNLDDLCSLETQYKDFFFREKFEPAIPKVNPSLWTLPIFRSLEASIRIIPPGWTRMVDASAPDLGIDVKLFFDAEFDQVEVKATHEYECVATCLSIGLAYRWVAQMAAAKRLVAAPMGVAYVGIERPLTQKIRPIRRQY